MKQTLRIMHVSHNYYPFVGGIERVVQGLAEAQAAYGHEVFVITSKFGSQERPSSEVVNNVHIERISSRRYYFPDLTVPKEMPLKLLQTADIIHVHSQNSLFGIRILSESFKLGVKNACYFMAVNSFRDHPNFLIRLFGSYYGRRNVNRALELSQLILVRSLRDSEQLKNMYGINAIYMPDAVLDSILTTEKAKSGNFIQKFAIKQRYFFLFVGRMHKLKGPHILVNALKYTNNEVAAVFIGPDGGYLKETLRLAEEIGVKDRTYVLGFVSEATKIEAIDAAVALILPSIANYVEVYPGVISEAWARGKPVIASSVGGVPSRVKDHINGLLVSPSNPRLLAEAMMEIVRNTKLAEEMGRNGESDVFSWKTIACKSIELYLKILKE